jgi:hypothetical protein
MPAYIMVWFGSRDGLTPSVRFHAEDDEAAKRRAIGLWRTRQSRAEGYTLTRTDQERPVYTAEGADL